MMAAPTRPRLSFEGAVDYLQNRPAELLVLVPIVFNLWVLRAERLGAHNLNDTSVHLAMVQWATERLREGHLPFDGWWPRVSLGLAQFRRYQSLPHILAAVLALAVGPLVATNWILYLGLSFWPISVYAGARLFELDRRTAVAAAVISPLLVSASGYGWEHSSYTWRGLGVWSQLWGMWLMPIAVPLGWRAVKRGRGYAVAAGAIGFTFAVHFLTGYVTLLSVGLWVLITPREFLPRVRRAALVGVGAILTISWIVVPLVTDSRHAAQTIFNKGVFWDDSYGARRIMSWLLTGQVFDAGRFPIVSIFVAIGAALCVVRFRSDERARALLSFTVFSLVLWFGRATFGGFTRVLPGGDDLIMHRFISGVHTGGLFLAGVGAVYAGQLVLRGLRWLALDQHRGFVVRALPAMLLVVLVPAFVQIHSYDARGAELIRGQRANDRTDGADFDRLVAEAKQRGGGRIYAGMTNNWARNQSLLFAVPLYIELLNQDADAIGFTLRTVSLMSDVEVYFDETNAAQYDLFNARYAILPVDRKAPPGGRVLDEVGRFRLYQVPTTGYLEVVDTITPPIATDRGDLSKDPAAFLTSDDLAKGRIPTVAFDGDVAAPPTLPLGAVVSGPAGSVIASRESPDDGEYDGTVTLQRSAAVMLKVAYDKRWNATVDGRSVKPYMVAPALMAINVPAGRHDVAFTYRQYQWFGPLLAIGAVNLAALAIGPSWWARRRRDLSMPR